MATSGPASRNPGWAARDYGIVIAVSGPLNVPPDAVTVGRQWKLVAPGPTFGKVTSTVVRFPRTEPVALVVNADPGAPGPHIKELVTTPFVVHANWTMQLPPAAGAEQGPVPGFFVTVMGWLIWS